MIEESLKVDDLDCKCVRGNNLRCVGHGSFRSAGFPPGAVQLGQPYALLKQFLERQSSSALINWLIKQYNLPVQISFTR